MEIIRLRDALSEMDKNSQPFSIAFVTADKKRNTGGRIISLKNVVQTGYMFDKEPTPEYMGDQYYGSARDEHNKRNPNHSENGTRNISVKGTTQIRKIHIRLITEFNGKKVIY